MSHQHHALEQSRAASQGWSRPAVFACVAAALALAPTGAHSQTRNPLVTLATVVESDVSAGHTVTGSVAPLRTSLVGSAVDGRVEQLLVHEGDHVTKGQPLARLRTRSLEIQLSAAKAELLARQHELAEQENGSLPEELAQAKARMLKTEAHQRYTAAKLSREETLYKSRTNSNEDYESALSEATQAEQAYLEAKAAFELAQKGPRKEKLAQLRARVLIQQEEIRRIEDDLEMHTLTAPFDGYVVAEHTEVGQWLSKGGPAVELAELANVEIEIFLLEDFAQSLRPGATTRVQIGALPHEQFTGTVSAIVPRANLRSRSFPVKIRVANQERDGSPVLKAGMFASVTLAVGSTERAMLVPKDALVLGKTAPLVFVADHESASASVRSVPVELGVATGDLIQVSGDLHAGDHVVIQGNEQLIAGQDVTVLSSRSRDLAIRATAKVDAPARPAVDEPAPSKGASTEPADNTESRTPTERAGF